MTADEGDVSIIKMHRLLVLTHILCIACASVIPPTTNRIVAQTMTLMRETLGLHINDMASGISDDEGSFDSVSTEVSKGNVDGLPPSSDQSLAGGRLRRHRVFERTNVVTKHMPVPDPDLWRRCFAKSRTHVKFTDASVGARELLHRCGIFRPSEASEAEFLAREATLQHLTDVLSCFQAVVAPVGPLQGLEYTARIDASVGPDGKKCPKFHVDNVPARLIMSILGPGCVYVPENVVDAGDEADFLPRVVDRRMLGAVRRTTSMSNDLIVPPEVVEKFEVSPVKQARQGDVLLLMGGQWQDAAPTSCGDCASCKGKEAVPSEEGAVAKEHLFAAVHRSPDIKQGQERILLVVDLVDW